MDGSRREHREESLRQLRDRVGVFGSIHLAHAARAEWREDLTRAWPVTDREVHDSSSAKSARSKTTEESKAKRTSPSLGLNQRSYKLDRGGKRR